VAHVNRSIDILVSGVRKAFQPSAGSEQVVAIKGLDFHIGTGEMVAIVGQTGCGKSTFLNMLIGLDHPTGGEITIGGKRPYIEFDEFRGVIAPVFQQDRLLPWRSALDNVRLPLELLGRNYDDQVTLASEWLDRLGLTDFKYAYPHELSGGMRQRVSLARAFATKPQLMLADEAFGHLDEVTSASLRRSFMELARREHKTAIVVTHQLEEAIEMGGRILVFGRPGHLLADIRLAEVPNRELPGLRGNIQEMLQLNQAPTKILSVQPRSHNDN
jgi:NitT/TauT family transport system ATP-binding protein